MTTPHEAALQQALEAMELARRSHGVLLLSDPPQEAWKTARVDGVLFAAIESARAALAAEIENVERDAARYRWFRQYLPSNDTSCDEAIVAALTPEELDSAIDAAMAGGSK